MKLASAQRWDEFAPLGDGRNSDAKRLGSRCAGAVIRNNGAGEHFSPSLSMLDLLVKHAETEFKYPKHMGGTTIDLAEVFRRARKDHGLTQTQVADAVGVRTSAISQIESGTTRPKPETFAKLCAFYGLNEHSTLFGDNDPPELKKIRGLAHVLGNRPRSRSRE